MRIDRVIYLATIVCVTVNRALIVFDNYQRMKERRERRVDNRQETDDERVQRTGEDRDEMDNPDTGYGIDR